MMQSLIPSIYPSLKDMFHLSFAQIGLITLVFQCTASLLQPVVGFVADKRPMPFSLPIGAAFTLIGIAGLGLAQSYAMVLVSAAIVGIGSSGVYSGVRRRGRAAWPRAILVSGRRQHRLRARSHSRGLGGRHLWPSLDHLLRVVRGGVDL